MDGDGAAAETRVRFGTKDWQTMPVEMAEMLLMAWRQAHPAQFGKVLAEVVTADVNGHRA